jgi:hypothetical protein
MREGSRSYAAGPALGRLLLEEISARSTCHGTRSLWQNFFKRTVVCGEFGQRIELAGGSVCGMPRVVLAGEGDYELVERMRI